MKIGKKKREISLPSESFPSSYVTDSEKNTKKFGGRIGRAIQYEWFKADGGSSSRFFANWDLMNKRLRYAMADQPIGKYKNELSVKGDLSYLNLDWTPVPILPKFVDIVVNGMLDRGYKIKAFGQDAASSEKRRMFQETLEKDMVARPLLEQIQSDFGVDTFATDQESLPQDAEELQLRMHLDYKDDLEIAEEISLRTLFEDNYWHDVEKQLYYDQTVRGISIAKTEFLLGDRARIFRVKPEDTVHSYTEDPDFKDVFYWGEVKTAHVSELHKIKPGITKEELDEIKEYAGQWNNKYRTEAYYQNNMFDKDIVTLLYYSYKTTKKIVHKDKGDKVIEKPDDWDPPIEMQQERGFTKIEKEIDVWYNGVMVLGTDIVLKWELDESTVRSKSNSQYAMPPYVACAPRMINGKIESLLDRMIPFADLIQLSHLKLQQVVQKVLPDGVFIDADGINEVDLGNGAKYNPAEALSMFLQTGSVIGRSNTMDGEFNHARVPIQELNHNSGMSKIQSLIGTYNHYLSMLRDVTGLNEARDGSDPDPNALVGIQKMAAYNSNVATRHILHAVLNVTKGVALNLSCMISEILKNEAHREDFVRKVGKYNVMLLDEIKDLHMHDFAISIELEPDEEERQMLEQNIQVALSRETIEIEDVIDIREVRNLRMANQLLKIRKKRKRQRDNQERAMMEQMKAQLQMQAQEQAAMLEMQKTQAKTQGEISVKQAETGFSIEKMNHEAEKKKELMALEAEYAMGLKNIEYKGIQDREKMKEEAKDKRIDRQSTQQSKLIEQRQKNLSSFNFESNEDSLDGFDLAEFEPR